MGLLLLQGASDLNPRELFANGEQGLWLDPSQMSTLYQDSNGVTPCTAAGDPVGLILDQSRGGLGNLGPELVPGTYTGTVSGTWAIGSTSITRNSSSTGQVSFTLSEALSTAKRYRLQFTVSNLSGDTFGFRLGGAGATVQVSSNGVYTANMVSTGSNASIVFIPWGGSAGEATISNISVREVPGNHAYQTTSASRPTLQTTGGLWYLSFDGSDDSLVTNAVDFTATDEMTVIAGVRKLSDATNACVAELSASYSSNFNSFALFTGTPSAAGGELHLSSRGGASAATTQAGVSAAFASPVSLVATGFADISNDSSAMRINGAASGTIGTGDQGTGNYGTYQLFIGRRNQATFPYNGHIYQLIIRGKTTPTGKLLEAERFVGRKTGVSF